MNAMKLTYLLFFELACALVFTGSFLMAMFASFKQPWSRTMLLMTPFMQKVSKWWWVLYVPMIFFAHDLFPWKDFDGHKEIYFSPIFLSARSLLNIVVLWWCWRDLEKRKTLLLLTSFILGSFFAVDWGMSFQKHWASNIYPLLYLLNFALAFMSLIFFILAPRLDDRSKADFSHLLITVGILWAYIHFSQFIIFWMGNKPSEVIFYLVRQEVAPIMISVIGFLKIVPLLCLGIFRRFKHSVNAIRVLCLLLMASTIAEELWLLGPVSGIKALAPIMIELIFFAVLLGLMKKEAQA
jgi:hypothetical protein